MEVTIGVDGPKGDEFIVKIDGEEYQRYFTYAGARFVSDKLASKISDLNRCNRFFIYGTLKTGYKRNELLTNFGAVKVADVQVDGFTLLDCNRQFPAMIESSNDYVVGELWEAPANPVRALALLDELDILEGVPRMYRRELVETNMQLQPAAAWAYVWNAMTQGLSPCGSVWPKQP